MRAALASLTYPTMYGDATGVDSYPYFLLWSTPGSDDVEPSLVDGGAWSDLIGVTTADTTAGNVLTTVAQARDLLDGLRLTIPGRHAVLHLQRGLGQPVTVDRSITIPTTNTHPCFQVDRYLLISQPI